MEKEFMGAGILPFCSKTNRFLVLLRNDDKPTWGTIGGGKEKGESPLKTAKREFAEETRVRPNCQIIDSYVNNLHKGKYYNYIGVFDKEFKPKLDNENLDYKWCSFKELLNLDDKHYGLLELLQNDFQKIKGICSKKHLHEFYSIMNGFLTEKGIITLYNSYTKLNESEGGFDPFEVIKDMPNEHKNKKCFLKFSLGKDNSKLKYLKPITLDLPAGYFCTFAGACKTLANRHGKHFKSTGTRLMRLGKFDCYAAKTEVYQDKVRDKRWKNADLILPIINNRQKLFTLLEESIDYYEFNFGKISTFRLHDSGDFKTQAYFDAWMDYAKSRPDIFFYGYTTSIPYWLDYKKREVMPFNVNLIASDDTSAKEELDSPEGRKLRRSYIVKSIEEAREKGLKIDTNEIYAAFYDGDIALLLHGKQPGELLKIAQKNTRAANLLNRIRNKNINLKTVKFLMNSYIKHKKKSIENIKGVN